MNDVFMEMTPVELVGYFSTGVISFVLIISGIGKFRSPHETLTSMRALHVPSLFVRSSVAMLLPLWELALGVLLFATTGALRVGVIVAIAVTLMIFTLLLMSALRRGDTVECNCFGSWSMNTRVSASSVWRNVALIGVTLFALFVGIEGASLISVMIAGDTVGILTLLVLWLSVLCVFLLWQARRAPATSDPRNPRQSGRSYPEPIPPMSPASLALGLDPLRTGEVVQGEAIPKVELVTGTGETHRLDRIGGGRPVLLLTLSLDCGTCIPVLENASHWVDAFANTRLVIATSSSAQQFRERFPELAPSTLFGAQALIAELGVQRSPAAVLLGGHENSVVASPLVYGLKEIEGLVASVLRLEQQART